MRKWPHAFDEILFWVLAFFAGIASFVISSRNYELANLPQTVFIQTGAFLVLSLWFLKALLRESRWLKRTSLDLPILLFVIWCWMSIAWSHNRYECVLLCTHWSACALIYLITTQAVRSVIDATRLMAALFLAGVVVALIGMCQYLFEVKWFPQAIPPAATFVNKNLAAQYVVPLLPLGVALFFWSRRAMWMWVFAVGTTLMCAFLFYTSTKAAWVAASCEVVLLSVLLLLEHRKSRTPTAESPRKIAPFVVCAMILLLLVSLTPSGFRWNLPHVFDQSKMVLQPLRTGSDLEEVPEELRQMGYEGSVGVRLAMWRNTLEMVRDHPLLGVGAGNFKIQYPRYHEKIIEDTVFGEHMKFRHLHNDYIQMLAELGPVGLILALGIGVALFRILFGFIRGCNSEKESRYLAIGLFVGVVGLMVNAFFSFPLYNAVPPFSVAVMLGILGGLSSNSDVGLRTGRSSPTRLQRKVVLIGVVLSLALLVIVVHTGMRRIGADVRYRKMARAFKKSDWQGTITWGEEAYRLNPNRKEILSYIGLARINVGDPERGIEELKTMTAVYPYDINSLLNLGKGYEGVGNLERAAEVYREVIIVKESFAKAHNNLGNIYRQQGRPADALKEYSAALEHDPTEPVYHYSLGVAYYDIKSYQQAAGAFRNAIRTRPAFALAHKELGRLLYVHLGDKDAGLRHLQKALDADPRIKGAGEIRRLLGVSR